LASRDLGFGDAGAKRRDNLSIFNVILALHLIITAPNTVEYHNFKLGM
jgi:hypothetical protein